MLPLVTWYLFSLLDAVLGLNLENADLEATDDDLYWYRLVTLIWVPAQFLTVFGLIWYVPQADHLGTFERVALFFGVGVITGTIGINYSHELMHQKNRLERFLADVLLAMVLYSHFRSEHLLVHHRYVATPRDPVTARYNEGFHRFYPRVLRQSLSFCLQGRKGECWPARTCPGRSWQPVLEILGLQAGFSLLALLLGGWAGVGLFLVQAGVAIWQLELVNYIEHYGLTRKHLGEGKYEHVQPRHSWNAAHKASNWLLINLQRHSDHHYKPDRRFPVLQNYDADDAPQLPYGYPVMTMAAMVPPAVAAHHEPTCAPMAPMYYPEITDWGTTTSASTPMPR